VRGLRNALRLTTQHLTPIVLSNHFTDLAVKYVHLNTMHGVVQFTRAITQQQLWIINGKKALRVNATCLDYTGSIDLKASRFRRHTTYKAYIAVFICLASKGVHLELMTGLTAEHFFWALPWFIVRHVYSDSGTNCITADKSLYLWNKEFRQGINEIVVPELTKRFIQ